MKKLRLNDTTKLVITRGSTSMPSAYYTFTTTYGQAKKSDDFATHGGTMTVTVELCPSEYENYEGWGLRISRFPHGLYLDEPELGQEYIHEGKPRILEPNW